MAAARATVETVPITGDTPAWIDALFTPKQRKRIRPALMWRKVIAWDTDLPAAAPAVAHALEMDTGDPDEGRVTVARLARNMRRSERFVNAGLQELREAGYVESVGVHHLGNGRPMALRRMTFPRRARGRVSHEGLHYVRP